VADLIELKNICMGTPDGDIVSKLINKISDSTDDIIESLNNEKP